MKKLINFPVLIRNIWFSLWIVLAILLVMKFCFNTWYPITTSNKTIINICSYIDNHKYLAIGIHIIFYCLNVYLAVLTSTVKKRLKLVYTIPIILFAAGTNILKHYFNNLAYILEFLVLIIFPIVYNIIHKPFKKMIWNILFPIIINAIFMVWQLNILFIRNIQELLINMPTLISLLLQLDYYIFLIITWIGVVHIMSVWGIWFFQKQLSYFRSLKAKELNKKNPDKAVLEDIENQITYYENKVKAAA